MKLARTSLVAAFFALFAQITLAATTTLTGKIAFSRSLPPKLIRMNADPDCLKAHGGQAVPSEEIEVNPNHTLKDVFVYIKSGVDLAKVPPAPTTPVVLDQQGCLYHPHVFGIRVGQPLEIRNSDPVLHNVHSLAKTNRGFNVGMATKGEKVEKKFAKPEVMVHVKCDVHGWMSAYAGVLNHPYFAVTDKEGRFTISGLPPGHYTLEAWQEKLGTKTVQVVASPAGGKKTVDIRY